MVDTSVQYNLTNPAFTDDIGMSNLDRALPMAPASFGGSGIIPADVTSSMSGVRIKGQLTNDLYYSARKEQNKKTLKKVLTGAGLIAAGILCFKGGKKIVNLVKGLFGKIKAKFKK